MLLLSGADTAAGGRAARHNDSIALQDIRNDSDSRGKFLPSGCV